MFINAQRTRAYMSQLKTAISFVFLGILLTAAGWWGSFSFVGDPPLDKAAEMLSEEIVEKREEAKAEIQEVKRRFQRHGVDSTMVLYADYYGSLYDNEGLFIAAFDSTELVFWSDNRVAFDYLFGPGIPNEQYLQLENGWYGLLKLIEQGREYYALFLIRSEYPYQNEHLRDDFQRGIDLPNLYHIVLTPTPTSVPVVIDQTHVFELERTGRNVASGLWINFILLVAGIFLLLYGAATAVKKYKPSWETALVLPLGVIALRVASLYSHSPFAQIKLFDPTLYASSFLFPSLGDLFINSLVLAFVTHFLYRRLAEVPRTRFSVLGASFFLLIYFGFALLISPLIVGLIEDSRISFNLNNIFGLEVYTLLAVTAIGLLLYALYFVGASVLRRFSWKEVPPNKILLAVLFAVTAHIVLAHLYGVVDFKIILWPLPSLALTILTLQPKSRLRVQSSFALLLFSVFITGLAILKYAAAKERNERLVYAERLASDEDPVTELLFSSAIESIRNDDHIARTIEQPNRYTNAALGELIVDKFIDRYWNKYNFSVQVYKPDGRYWGVLPELRPPDMGEFDKLIEERGFPSTATPHLYHLYNYPENLSYLAKIPLFKNDTTQTAWVFIGLESTLFPDEIGFPSLLIDQTANSPNDLKKYSYARYVDDKLVATAGEYNYRINTRLFKDNTARFEFEDYKGYSHLVHHVDDKTIMVVSLKKLNFFNQMVVFSYLFGLFGLLLLLILFLRDPGAVQPGFFSHLNVKIQMLSAGIILLALLSFGIATRFYIEEQFKEKNNSILNEKIQSVMIELDGILKNETTITKPMIDQLESRVSKLSYVFFTDINIYDTDGLLLATSQPRIFETGLVAPRMNAEAFVKIAINKKSDYIHQERIGKLKYLSAYVPFRNLNNDIVAYVNLPYFSRQDALEEELSGLFVTLVNIFVMLLATSVIAAIFISNWITRPLQKLQTSLSKIELGRRNEPIEYKGHDVIGSLVEEYNRKVMELEINAEQLARSERESAWREMAKQVAHEIKNPLTPMKLNLQLLQKAVSEGADNIDARIERTSEVMIEQIDALTEIANAFSNFAKMPRAELAEVDLNKLVSSAVKLYDELPGGQVHFSPLPNAKPIVRADYNQLSRAVQNLIKNGLQAAHENEMPRVNIEIHESENFYEIRIKDNGQGIPKDLQARIFQPNFTTKSTGMGLGLAMVMSIVKNINGRIWFETEPKEGTTFFIEIHKVNSDTAKR